MNIVIYARFSSHNQNEQSIEGQLKVCYEFAERNGYKVIGEYIEACVIIEPTRRSLINQGFQGLVNFLQTITHDRGLCLAT